jgi:hypothetical protein
MATNRVGAEHIQDREDEEDERLRLERLRLLSLSSLSLSSLLSRADLPPQPAHDELGLEEVRLLANGERDRVDREARPLLEPEAEAEAGPVPRTILPSFPPAAAHI